MWTLESFTTNGSLRSVRKGLKTTIAPSFFLSVCLSVCPHAATWLSWHGNSPFSILDLLSKSVEKIQFFFKFYKISNHFYGNIIYSSSSYSKIYSSTMRINVALLVNWNTFITVFPLFTTKIMQEIYRDWNTHYGEQSYITRTLPPYVFPAFFCLQV